VVEYLPSKCEALSSNPRTEKEKKNPILNLGSAFCLGPSSSQTGNHHFIPKRHLGLTTDLARIHDGSCLVLFLSPFLGPTSPLSLLSPFPDPTFSPHELLTPHVHT
jgi:hypothetical protein